MFFPVTLGLMLGLFKSRTARLKLLGNKVASSNQKLSDCTLHHQILGLYYPITPEILQCLTCNASLFIYLN